MSQGLKRRTGHRLMRMVLFLTPFLLFRCAEIETTPLSYGAFLESGYTYFRVHSPEAERLYLVLFDRAEDSTGREFPMKKHPNGDWDLKVEQAGVGTLYGYRAVGTAPGMDSTVIVADPYSKAVVTQNIYNPIAKSLIVDGAFNWEGDRWQTVDPRDLVIYELHVRDMTAHPTSGARQKGTYLGLVDIAQKGGLTHLEEMGINAVQLMPCQEFANVEPPYMDPATPVMNTWNPYARNHWGYMTSYFFAPESYFATDGTMEPGAWNGRDGRAVTEFKEMVKTFHEENIAVIMDVVYNHVSNYDYNPLKYLDRETYFRFDSQGNWESKSGCGNDTRTENPIMRELILESLKYWMTEYHVDGFRFDLGNLIDPTTREWILAELREINPGVIILAEPWGGGYEPALFSEQGWASFNDQFRDGLKGSVFNIHDQGFLFGKFRNGDDQKFLQRLVMGSLRDYGGPYLTPAHSVNYLESHDDYTFGDRLRITGGFVSEKERIKDRTANAKVSGPILAMSKLGALFLFTSQGIVFMHQGQEWARSKVIAPTTAPDPNVGLLDHNSYEKDNETNWLNWDEKSLNPGLVDYYRGLIQLRKRYPEFRHSSPPDFQFLDLAVQPAVGYLLQNKFLVILNGNTETTIQAEVPPGNWLYLADENQITPEGENQISGTIQVPPTSGVVLKRIP